MGEKGNIFEGTGRRQEFLPPEDRCFPRDLSLLSGLHTDVETRRDTFAIDLWFSYVSNVDQ